jgi:hypothetical protein
VVAARTHRKTAEAEGRNRRRAEEAEGRNRRRVEEAAERAGVYTHHVAAHAHRMTQAVGPVADKTRRAAVDRSWATSPLLTLNSAALQYLRAGSAESPGETVVTRQPGTTATVPGDGVFVCNQANLRLDR